jgi:choice-of-anchor A domain-containing protein
MQGYSANGVTKVTGSIGGNGNGISNKPNYIYAGGTIAGKLNAGTNAANVYQNYNYTANGAVSAPVTLGTPTAPTAPVAPTAAELGTTTVVPLSTMAANMKSLSTALLTQGSVNATAQVLTNQNGTQRATIKVTASANDAIAVINVNQSLFSSFSEIDYQFNNTSTVVIINVLNSGNSFNAGTGALANTNYTYNWNMNGIGSLASANKNQQIIWNFADASSLNLNRETWGSFLAPNADVYNSNSINGSLVAKVFHQGGEVHLGTFNGFDGLLVASGGSVDNPLAAPEPSSWATMLLGFGAIGTMVRRHKRNERELAKAA